MRTHARGPHDYWHRRLACLFEIHQALLLTWLSFEAKASCLFLSTFVFSSTSELCQIQESQNKIVSSAESTKDKPGQKFGLDLVAPGCLAIRGLKTPRLSFLSIDGKGFIHLVPQGMVWLRAARNLHGSRSQWDTVEWIPICSTNLANR